MEDLLKDYFGLEYNMYDEDGELTRSGEVAYSKMIDVVYELGNLLGRDVNEIVDNLDELIGEIGILGR